MSIYEELFEQPGAAEKPVKPKDSYLRDEWAKRRAQERAEIFDLADEIALEAVSDGEKFRALLDVGARMLNESSTNVLLIAAQMPSATALKSFEEWKELGTYVKRGERCIRLIKPGKEYTKDDGSKATYIDVVRQYDISQTGSNKETTAAAAGNTRMEQSLLLRCILDLPTVDFVASDSLPNNMCAFFSPETKTVLVRRGAAREQALRELLCELAHNALAAGSDNYARETASDTAVCASYILSSRYGLDTSQYDFRDIISRISETAENSRDIRGAYNDIHTTAKRISYGIENAYRRYLKEKEREAAAIREE